MNSPELTPDVLTAFADGELSVDEMSRVAGIVEARPDLLAFVERQQALRKALGAAFDPVLNQPVPARLADTLAFARPAWRLRLADLRRHWSAAQWRRGAIPAGLALALGLLIGIGIERSATPLVNASPGAMTAQGELDRALNSRLASDDMVGGLRIGVSFRNTEGQDCRTFELTGTTANTSGIACRASGSWSIAALATTPHDGSSTTPYQMAAASMPDAIRTAVNAMIAGAPYDAAAERRARDRNWQGSPRP